MALVSVTRLRIRAWRFIPAFAAHTFAAARQVARADGFRGGETLADRDRIFWTRTLWDSEAALRAYMLAGVHARAMAQLIAWCDEAAVARWAAHTLPDWAQAAARLREIGRPSRVRHPSPRHADLSFPGPAATRGLVMRPARV